MSFSDWMAQKYNNLEMTARANANLTNTQAGLMPGQVASENALRGAQTFSTNESAKTIAPLAQSTMAKTSADIWEGQQRGSLYGAQATNQSLMNGAIGDDVAGWLHGQMMGNRGGLPSGLFNPTPRPDGGVTVPAFAKGTAMVPAPSANFMAAQGTPAGGKGLKMFVAAGGRTRVPGQGSGKVDTVPAMLAPGEAVLNKGAAEHVGRGKIVKLNKIGLKKMGVPAGTPSKAKR